MRGLFIHCKIHTLQALVFQHIHRLYSHPYNVILKGFILPKKTPRTLGVIFHLYAIATILPPYHLATTNLFSSSLDFCILSVSHKEGYKTCVCYSLLFSIMFSKFINMVACVSPSIFLWLNNFQWYQIYCLSVHLWWVISFDCS